MTKFKTLEARKLKARSKRFLYGVTAARAYNVVFLSLFTSLFLCIPFYFSNTFWNQHINAVTGTFRALADTEVRNVFWRSNDLHVTLVWYNLQV